MAKPFSVGSEVKSSDGTPAKLCRSMRAPFWVCHQGRVVADYGDDEDAAWEHLQRLVREHRQRWLTGQWSGLAA